MLFRYNLFNSLTDSFTDPFFSDKNHFDFKVMADVVPVDSRKRQVKRADNVDKEGYATFTYDVPGISIENVKVELEADTLYIDAHNDSRSYANVLSLKGWDTSTLNVSLSNGVLSIKIKQKVKEAESKRVAVKVT